MAARRRFPEPLCHCLCRGRNSRRRLHHESGSAHRSALRRERQPVCDFAHAVFACPLRLRAATIRNAQPAWRSHGRPDDLDAGNRGSNRGAVLRPGKGLSLHHQYCLGGRDDSLAGFIAGACALSNESFF